ncbi:hypothetical protein CAURIC_06065 [Corynebacterium auriscanis]|nr:hypothetical protein CAURIC_06065 [Corynebacterium auriscanis]
MWLFEAGLSSLVRNVTIASFQPGYPAGYGQPEHSSERFRLFG